MSDTNSVEFTSVNCTMSSFLTTIQNLSAEIKTYEEKLLTLRAGNQATENLLLELTSDVKKKLDLYAVLANERKMEFVNISLSSPETLHSSDHVVDLNNTIQMESSEKTDPIDSHMIDVITNFTMKYKDNYSKTMMNLRNMLPKQLGKITLWKKIQPTQWGMTDFSLMAAKEGVVVVCGSGKMLMFTFSGDEFESIDVDLPSCIDIAQKNRVLMGNSNGIVSLINFELQNNLTLFNQESAISSVKVHPTQLYGASSADNGTWRLFDLENGKILRTANMEEPIIALDLHPAGARLAACSSNLIRVWDIRKEEKFKDLIAINTVSIKFLPRGNLFFWNDGNGLRMVDLNLYPKGEAFHLNPYDEKGVTTQFHSSGRLLCCYTGNHLWFLSTDQKDDRKTNLGFFNTMDKVVHEYPILDCWFDDSNFLILTKEELVVYNIQE